MHSKPMANFHGLVDKAFHYTITTHKFYSRTVNNPPKPGNMNVCDEPLVEKRECADVNCPACVLETGTSFEYQTISEMGCKRW